MAEILIDEHTLSGVVTDEAGRQEPFQGWLELIGLLQEDDHAGDQPPPRPDLQ